METSQAIAAAVDVVTLSRAAACVDGRDLEYLILVGEGFAFADVVSRLIDDDGCVDTALELRDAGAWEAFLPRDIVRRLSPHTPVRCLTAPPAMFVQPIDWGCAHG